MFKVPIKGLYILILTGSVISSAAVAQSAAERCFRGKEAPSAIVSLCTEAIRDPAYKDSKEVAAVFHVSRGNGFALEDRLEEAIMDYTAAIILDPRLAVANLNRGDLRLRIGAHDQAIADYNEVLRLEPNHPTARDKLKRAIELKDLTRSNRGPLR